MFATIELQGRRNAWNQFFLADRHAGYLRSQVLLRGPSSTRHSIVVQCTPGADGDLLRCRHADRSGAPVSEYFVAGGAARISEPGHTHQGQNQRDHQSGFSWRTCDASANDKEITRETARKRTHTSQ